MFQDMMPSKVKDEKTDSIWKWHKLVKLFIAI